MEQRHAVKLFYELRKLIGRLRLADRYRNAWEQYPHRLEIKSFYLVRSKPVERPVFLLGTQGGGLTLIARTLRKHDATVYCSGNRYFWAGRDEMQEVGWDFLHPQAPLRKHGSKMDLESFFGDFASKIYACDDLVDAFRVQQDDVSPDAVKSLRNLVAKYVSAFGLGKTVPRFVDKSQSFSLKIPLLLEAFPDAKFVLVSRDPYPLVHGRSSRIHFEAARQIGFQGSPRELLRLRAEHWRNTFQIAQEELMGQDYHFSPFRELS